MIVLFSFISGGVLSLKLNQYVTSGLPLRFSSSLLHTHSLLQVHKINDVDKFYVIKLSRLLLNFREI